MSKKSFVLYHDQCEIFAELSAEDAGKLIKAIIKSSDQLTQSKPVEPSGLEGLLAAIYKPFKSHLIRDYEKSRCNENHWNWQGGVSSENHKQRNSAEYKEWRLGVFERDNYTCLYCHQKGRELNAHHVKHWSKYPEKRFDVNNGTTLCKQCHIDVHRGEK